MIARIQGVLESIDGGMALIRLDGGLTYEVLVSVFTAARLGGSIGQAITLQTLHYLEGQNQGATMYPRLAGFLTTEDRDFYELFTTTKGIGNKRALRAMTLPTAQIAAAIADRDLATLQSLPEVGRRTAETIVATLHGKVDGFLSAAVPSLGPAGGGQAGGGAPSSMAREALEAMMQLGENRAQALMWIDQALREGGPDDRPRDASDLIARVYRIKGGG